ncbi:2-phospho-L-lactate guanylyltransferase [Saccharopolyspora sp. NPDC002376]
MCSKQLGVAKTRLAGAGKSGRVALTLAMVEDVLTAATATPCVQRTTLVTACPELTAVARAHGAGVVPDPGNGLNAAFRSGAADAGGKYWTAYLPGDLPCLAPELLSVALQQMAAHPLAVIADRAGGGTTMLTAAPGETAPLCFGRGSLSRHLAAGAREITPPRAELACDVDSLPDLWIAVGYGVGRATRAAIRELPLERYSEAAP